MPQRVAVAPAAEASPASVPEQFIRQAARHPERIALECADRRVTYGELDAASARIARFLRAKGIGRGSVVALYLERDAETIAAVLGVLKAGAAYLPLDLSYPPRLLAEICAEADPALVLSQPGLMDRAEGASVWQCPAVDVGEVLAAEATSTASRADATNGVQTEDLAYIMYTSGSTGRHKGVMVPHRAVLRLVRDVTYARLDANETFLQLAPLSFDASTFEIWGALLNGGKLALLPGAHPSIDDISAAIARHRVTTLWLTAGLFHLMVDLRLEALRPLRQLLAGGDVLSPARVARALAALPGTTIINGYGPTENTTFTCCHRISLADCRPGPIPIGRPIEGTTAYVCGEDLAPVATGQDGELCVGGDGLALGYLKRPELTRDRFVTDPRSPSGARLYRTGDRVRRRADGSFEFLGRIDRQVKIDGKRIELEEIEACLRRSGAVGEAAAVCVTGGDGRPSIAAYATPGERGDCSVALLRGHLRRELPPHMMPASIMLLEKMPLTPAGKLDRAGLPPPAGIAPTSAVESQPVTDRGRGEDTAAALRRMWQQVLAQQRVGVDDNFFDLGGTSLQLLKLQAQILAQLKCNLPMVDMFRFPRISALAKRIDGMTGKRDGGEGGLPRGCTEVRSSSARSVFRP